ncbi:MAG: hypothetical protein EU539_08460 [Promethearchaeota archaeon]|nr:MAG: hypothetical protein EU539_08460 [Candidatus Lokiarchaeota archaeon]
MSEVYTNKQKKIALALYLSIAISCLVTIGGIVYTISDLIMATGKMALFLGLNIGYQIAIIGALLAGLFFLIVYFFGLYKKGVQLILRNIFRKKYYNDKYAKRIGVRIAAGALMLSIFTIIIGLLFAVFYELFTGGSDGGTLPLSTIFVNFSQGAIVLTFGLFLFLIIGLIFALNYLWYNGYYMILKLITDLEEE